MKKVIVLMGVAFGTYNTEGMWQSQSFPQSSIFSERNLDILPGYSLWQEQWEEQRRMQQLFDEIVSKTENIKFDESELINTINCVIKDTFVVLLKQALTGNVDALRCLSERIYSGRLMNKLIFTSETDLSQRKEVIFKISLEVYRKTCNASDFFENIKRFYPEKFKEWGISFGS